MELHSTLDFEPGPLDKVDLTAYLTLSAIIDADPPASYLITMNAQTFNRLKKYNVVINDRNHKVTINRIPGKLKSQTFHDKDSVIAAISPFFTPKSAETQSFDLVLIDPQKISITLKDNRLTLIQAEAQVFCVNRDRAKTIVDHFNKSEYQKIFDKMLREISTKAGRKLK